MCTSRSPTVDNRSSICAPTALTYTGQASSHDAFRHERIAELEAALAASEAHNAVKHARITELEQRVAQLRKQLTELVEKPGQILVTSSSHFDSESRAIMAN